MSTTFKIPFSGRAHRYTEDELDLVREAAGSAEPLTQGKFRNAFEAKFRNYIGVRHAFTTCNAASALELSAQLCSFEAGDEVIIPSHTYTASAYPVLKHGANIVWADIDPLTRVVNAESIEKVITKRTRAIVVVHLYGYGADMTEIMALARSRNLLVIEDAAQALGVDIDGKKAGAHADIGIFSFHSHKNVTTLGEGGMITVHDEDFARVIPMLRHNGHTGFPEPQTDYWIPNMGNVDLPELGGRSLMPNNFCLGEVECALGAALLDRIDEINNEKRVNAMTFIDAFSDRNEFQFHRENSTRHNYHLLVARIANHWRDDFIRTMSREFGIQCVVQYYPLNRYPFYQKLGFGNADCPVADDFFDNMVSFPFHHSLSREDHAYIIDSALKVLDRLAG
jgi:perosamine synthetase